MREGRGHSLISHFIPSKVIAKQNGDGASIASGIFCAYVSSARKKSRDSLR